MAAKKGTKLKKDYIDLLKDMIEFFSKVRNRRNFSYKRYYIERGFSVTGLKTACARHPEVKALYIEVKHIIADTLTRMILENRIGKDAFAIRTMKLMFKDLSYHTTEEIVQIEKLKSERELDTAQTMDITIGFSDVKHERNS